MFVEVIFANYSYYFAISDATTMLAKYGVAERGCVVEITQVKVDMSLHQILAAG